MKKSILFLFLLFTITIVAQEQLLNTNDELYFVVDSASSPVTFTLTNVSQLLVCDYDGYANTNWRVDPTSSSIYASNSRTFLYNSTQDAGNWKGFDFITSDDEVGGGQFTYAKYLLTINYGSVSTPSIYLDYRHCNFPWESSENDFWIKYEAGKNELYYANGIGPSNIETGWSFVNSNTTIPIASTLVTSCWISVPYNLSVSASNSRPYITCRMASIHIKYIGNSQQVQIRDQIGR